MSSDESSNSKHRQECVLGCKDGKTFYPFPDKRIMRDVWFNKLGLDSEDYYPYLFACNKHFSLKMIESNKKLKSSAIPDMNLPTELVSKCSEKQTAPNTKSKQNIPIKNEPKTKKDVKNPSNKSTNKVVSKTQNKTTATSTSQSRRNHSSPLVDYQLKVQGNHLCDIVEIPQYIVVFTVVKAKPSNIIQQKTILNNNKTQPINRPALKIIPHPQEIITIDDDDDNDDDDGKLSNSRSVPSKFSKTIPQSTRNNVQKIPQIVQVNTPVEHKIISSVSQSSLLPIKTLSKSVITQSGPSIPNKLSTHSIKPLRNVTSIPAKPQPAVPQKIPEVIFSSKLPEISHTKPPAVLPQNMTNVLFPKSSYFTPKLDSIQIKPIQKLEPELDIVYYTKQDVKPRRDRDIQVDFSTKYKETGVQCDFQLENDIMQMSSCKNELFTKQCNLKTFYSSNNIHECLICGEILKSNASKMQHAIEHEKSLCCKCGEFFESQMALKTHTKNFHLNNGTSRKPHRCPKRNCSKAFHSLKLLNKHIRDHVKGKDHKCVKCLQYFGSFMKLICHQKALDNCLRTRGWISRRWSKRI